MEKDVEKVFRELKADVATYVELRFELLKLDVIERIAKIIAILSHGLILVLLAFFATLFLFLGLGFFLGDLLGSTYLGFVIVAALYVLLFFILLGCGRRIRNNVSNLIIAAIMAKDDKDDDEQQTTDAPGTADR